jgi:hypothetical protein
MRKKTLVVLLATIAIVTAGICLFPIQPWHGYGIGPDEALGAVREHYPNVTGQPVFEENCTICDAKGVCTTISEPCWKVNVSVNDTRAAISVNPQTGDVMGEEKDCIWWQCTPIPCNYTVVSGEITSYNAGCDNPVPACDIELEMCRPCSEKQDCLRRKEYFYMREYVLIGTPILGYFNTLNSKCVVMEMFSGVVSEEECENKILSYGSCTDGDCRELI